MATGARVTEAWLEAIQGTTAANRVTEAWVETVETTQSAGRVTEAWLEIIDKPATSRRGVNVNLITSDPARLIPTARYYRTGGKRRL